MKRKPMIVHISGSPGDAPAWTTCDDCQRYWRENQHAVIFAASSVGIERKLTTNAAINIYFEERHAAHV